MVALANTTLLNERQWAALERARARWRLSPEAFRRFLAQVQAASFEAQEILICAADPQYFLSEYVYIYDALSGEWIPFALWPEQIDALDTIHEHQLTIILKARQLGLTWLCLGYILWLSLFRPIATIMLYSRRDDESMYLLSSERLRGMYQKLPDWMRTAIAVDNAHQLKLTNESVIYAFPTTAGDSYTSTMVLIDEADLVPNLNTLLRSVKPTIDAGGKLVLLSRVDKSQPNSEFKRIYRAAKAGENQWAHVFLPWSVHPGRDARWYAQQRQDIEARTGSDDDLKEQYPSTDVEAMEPRTLDKRIPPGWVRRCYRELAPLDADLRENRDLPDIPNLRVYRKPVSMESYVIGIDTAEGNPTSDDSALTILNTRTLEEVASLSGKFQPQVLASYADKLGRWYNHAKLMPERQNHGHAVIGWLRDNSSLEILQGHDTTPAAPKWGWNSSSVGKVLLYDAGAEAFRDSSPVLYTLKTVTQIQSIEGGTLRAPEGEMDDLSDSFMLAVVGAPQAISADWSKTEVV